MRGNVRHHQVSEIMVASLVVATFCCGLVLTSSYVSADDSYNADVSLTIPVACTMTGTLNTPHTANVEAGTYTADIGTTTLKTVCNDGNGFSIYAIGYSGLEYGNNKMLATVGGTLAPTYDIATGTATSGDTSNWAMKLNTVTGTYAPSIITGFDSYHAVPDTYTKVATRASGTDATVGASIQSTYAVYVTSLQPAGSYNGKVRYTLVHPNDADTPSDSEPQVTEAGKICYYPNGSRIEGTMGCQTIPTTSYAINGVSRTFATLLASNYSRTGYGFAGWSRTHDYSDPTGFLGPQEYITFTNGQYSGSNSGLSLYAHWIQSAGTMQDNAVSVCSSLTAATYSDEGDSNESTWSISASLNSISALTDTRDGQTYAIAKLPDGNCWMIENLRLADKDGNNNDVILSSFNTNNPSLPLTNVYDSSTTSNHLSPTSSVAYDATTAPEGWCSYYSAACLDQSRLRTDNTTNRATYISTDTMSANANIYSYGNYYNWYSATAGNGTYSKDNGNTVGDICPTGWHLPTGTGTGEFGVFSNSLGGLQNSGTAQEMSSSTSPTHTIMKQRLLHFPNNLVYSGNAYRASINERGDSGSYWLSTARGNGYAYYFNFGSLYIYPGEYANDKFWGWTVRCIANSS